MSNINEMEQLLEEYKNAQKRVQEATPDAILQDGESFIEKMQEKQNKYMLSMAKLSMDAVQEKQNSLLAQIKENQKDLAKLSDPRAIAANIEALNTLNAVYIKQAQELDMYTKAYEELKQQQPSFIDRIQNVMDKASRDTQEKVSQAVESMQQAKDETKEKAVEAVNGFVAGTKEMINEQKTSLLAFGDSAKEFLKSVHDKFTDIGDKAYKNFDLKVNTFTRKFMEHRIDKQIENLRTKEKIYEKITDYIEGKEQRQENLRNGLQFIKKGLNAIIGRDVEITEVKVERSEADKKLMQAFEGSIEKIKNNIRDQIKSDYVPITEKIEERMEELQMGENTISEQRESFASVKEQALAEVRAAEMMVPDDLQDRNSMSRSTGEER